jgi:hypothetical protein
MRAFPWFGHWYPGWSDIRFIPVDLIEPIGAHCSRSRIDMYAALLRAHQLVAPVSLIRCAAPPYQFKLEDGSHRLAACLLVGRTMIAARIRET